MVIEVQHSTKLTLLVNTIVVLHKFSNPKTIKQSSNWNSTNQRFGALQFTNVNPTLPYSKWEFIVGFEQALFGRHSHWHIDALEEIVKQNVDMENILDKAEEWV